MDRSRGSGDGPSISVVIPHYGDPALASRLVRALRGQSEAPEQVIVVDDASPVPYPRPADDDSLTVVRRERNGGFAAAVNSGAMAAVGEILTVLNSDVEIPRSFVASLRAAHRRFPGALVAPRVLGPAGTPTWACRRFPTIRSQALQHLRVVTGLQYRRGYLRACGMDPAQWRQEDAPTIADWIAGVVLSLPRETFEAAGGLCEDFHMYFEETDLQRRLAEMGVPRIHDPAFSVAHAEGGSTDADRAETWEMRSRFVYAQRWGRPFRLAAALTAVALANLPLDVIRRLRGRDVRPVALAVAQIRRTWAAWAAARTRARRT